jgi:hypothetical protein
MFCGARTRNGGRCRRYPVAGKRRCRLHGGKSTGPREWVTNVRAMAQGRAQYVERRHAMGLKAPGGRPRKLRHVLSDQERAMTAIDKMRGELAELEDVGALAGKLRVAGNLALDRMTEFCAVALTEEKMEQQPKLARLVQDASSTVLKIIARAGEVEMRARGDEALTAMLERLEAEGAFAEMERAMAAEKAAKRRPRKAKAAAVGE